MKDSLTIQEMKPRPPLELELKHVISFLNHSLRSKSNWSIDKEYPLVFCLENAKNLRIISKEDKVLSHAAFKPLWIRNPLGLFKAATIGSVVTHKDHRFQGLSQKVLESCLEQARMEACDFAILWTEIYDLYRKMDFELAGYEISFVIEKEFQAKSSSLRFMKTKNISSQALLKLYLKHSVYSLRSEEEIRKYLEIPGASVFTAWNEKNELKAYAIEGKGMDLSNYIHEWGGGVSELMSLFSYIRREKNTPITLIVPFHSQNLIRHLDQHKEEIHRHNGFLGMIRLLNTKAFFSKIKKYALSIGIQDFSFEETNKTFSIHIKGKTHSFASLRELTAFVFGIPNHNKDSYEQLHHIFPLPMWVWGWDSV